jgi:O-antigen polymerase
VGGYGLRVPFNVAVWLVANTIIWYSVYALVKQNKIVLPKYFYYLLSFPVLVTVSGFISGIEYPIVWFFRLIYIWYGLLFLVVLFQFKLLRA